MENLSIQDQHVLVVDDIYDSGVTLDTVLQQLSAKGPKTLSSAVLLSKKIANRSVPSAPDYVMFDIENEFVVGYGLDFKEFYRGLRGIYKLVEKE
jgi:hypoxanthine phosphoribosyltransferase